MVTNRKIDSNIADINPTISIIILNANDWSAQVTDYQTRLKNNNSNKIQLYVVFKKSFKFKYSG